MAKRRSPHVGGQQLPLILPASDWEPPAELPDLRNRVREVAEDLETRDDGLAAGRGPGWAYRAGYVAGVAWAWEEDGEVRSTYVPVRHPETACHDPDAVARWLADHRRAGIRFTYANAPYDLGWTQADLGVDPPAAVDDVTAMACIVDENRLSYKLDDLARWRGLPGKDEALLREATAAYGYEGDVKANLWRLPARYVGPYAAADAVATLGLARSLRPALEAEGSTAAYQLEADLIPMVLEMRRRGVRVDVGRAEQLRAEFLAERDGVLKELKERLGERREVVIDDVRSPRWMEHHFTAERVPFPRTPKTRAGSFQAKWMRNHGHWLPRLAARAEQLTEAADKFLKGFLIDFAHRGRLHACVNQFRSERGGTRSYRFSYDSPPLQQMPARDATFKRAIRGAFLPEDGETWGSLDWCHDDKTEVLTEEGWRLFRDVDEDQKVAQWDQGVISFVRPTARYVGARRYRQMVEVRGPRQLDFCVTQSHGMLMCKYGTLDGDVISASRISELFLKRELPQVGMKKGGKRETPDLLRLVAALQADAADRSVYGGRQWVFYLKRPRKIERLLKILRSLRIKPKVSACPGKGGQTRVSIQDRSSFRKYLNPGKTFNLKALLSLDEESREVFLEELPLWDGHGRTWGSTNLENVDSVQAIAACTNRRGAILRNFWVDKHLDKKPYRSLQLSRKTAVWGTRQATIRNVPYEGKVYCFSIPSGFLLTRRNGRTLVSSNSQQEYRLIVHFAAALDLPGAAAAAARYAGDPRTDFHSYVAEITGLERKPAKDSNFAKAYGAGPAKFASMIGRSVEEAQAIMAQYDRELPFVRLLSQRCSQLASSRGYVRLIDGARSHFDLWEPAWRDRDEPYAAPRPLAAAQVAWPERRLRRAFTHKAMNRLIQGSAARQMKLAMRETWREGIVPLLQMHDELDFSLAAREVGERVAEIMRGVVALRVPMLVDAEYGRNWGEAELPWEDAAEGEDE